MLSKYLEISQIIGVGDASVKRKRGSHSFILESTDEEYNIQGSAPVDGDPDDIDSNRAELCSVLAMMTFSDSIAKFFQISNSTIKIYCDNKYAVNHRDLKRATFTTLTKRDIDIKMQIQAIIKSSSIVFHLTRVPGHADDAQGFDYDKAPQTI